MKFFVKDFFRLSQNLDDPQNLLIKLTVKDSSQKAWLLYEF